jgi:histidine triad (HIT) family protein
MSECVFCGIALGKIPSYKVWENEEFTAVLDVFPRIKGQVVLMSKSHLDSDILGLPEETVIKFYLMARVLAGKMKQVLGVGRVCLVTEGLQVNHAHIKLFPVWDRDKYIGAVGGKILKADKAELADLASKFGRRDDS